MATSDQVTRKVPNPTGKGGFGDNPENRNSGGWVKSDTPRYKLEQMMKLSETELQEVIDDIAAPLFERKLATAIRDGNWTVIKEMTQEVYGRPKESVDLTTAGEAITMPTIRIIDDRQRTSDTG